jgi:hypothetical protein
MLACIIGNEAVSKDGAAVPDATSALSANTTPAINKLHKNQAESSGQDGLGFKSRPNPLQPGGFPGKLLEDGDFAAPFASPNAQDDLAREVVEVAGRGLLMAFERQQPAQLLEVLGIFTHTHFK